MLGILQVLVLELKPNFILGAVSPHMLTISIAAASPDD